MLDLVDRLEALGETLKDKMVIAMLLSSLPDSYNTLITVLETRSEEEFTTELVKSKLIDEASRRKNAKSVVNDNEDKALHTRISNSSSIGENAVKIDCFFL